MNDGQEISPLMRELSAYIAGALKRRLPADIVEHAKLHLVDTFAAMISGSRLIPGKRVTAYVKSLGGTRQAGIVGTRFMTSALHAALANGTCAHADETDDTHQGCNSHLGAVNVPAALAICEHKHVPGEVLLRALVLGYDVNTRMILALGARQLARAGLHASSKGGIFGAAAAAAALLGLDARRIRHVLSYCAEQAAGTVIMYRESQHSEKAFVAGGMPAHNGVGAALMVKNGFTGVEDPLSGEPNFLTIYSPDPDGPALIRGLGHDYEIANCAIKYWSAGGPIQAPLHVLREMIQQHKLQADDVEKLVVRVPDVQLEVVDDRDTPSITLQHLLAVMLVDGTVTFRSAHDYSRVRDAQVSELRRNRIEAVGDASLTEKIRTWRCAIEITLKDGRRLNHETLKAPGSMGNPLTRRQVEEKALDLMGPVLGKKSGETLTKALFNVDRLKDVCALRRLYAG